MDDKEAIDMMTRCIAELQTQQARITVLEPKAEAYEVIRDVVHLLPKQSRGYGEDLIWIMRKRIKELETIKVDNGSANL